MTAQATVSRNQTSVTFDIYDEGGNLAVARDIGKPELEFYQVAREAPRSFDGFSATDVFTVVGQFTGSSAYSDAKKLAEDLIRPHSNGDALTLDLSDVPGFTSYEVAVQNESALQLAYPPGQTDWVSVQLQATQVRDTIG